MCFAAGRQTDKLAGRAGLLADRLTPIRNVFLVVCIIQRKLTLTNDFEEDRQSGRQAGGMQASSRQTAGRRQAGGRQAAGRRQAGSRQAAGRRQAGGRQAAGRRQAGGRQAAGRRQAGGRQAAGGGRQAAGRQAAGRRQAGSRQQQAAAGSQRWCEVFAHIFS
jgi:hypothetical protein